MVKRKWTKVLHDTTVTAVNLKISQRQTKWGIRLIVQGDKKKEERKSDN